jgi:hypothetical protein
MIVDNANQVPIEDSRPAIARSIIAAKPQSSSEKSEI